MSACAGGAIVVGALVLVGWYANIPLLTSVRPGLASMKANTAALFILQGLALLGLARGAARNRRWTTLGVSSGTITVVVAVMTLMEYRFSIDFGIDQLLVREPVASPAPGATRMAALTATMFALIGTGGCLLYLRRLPRVVQSLALVTLLVAGLCGLSYFYGGSSAQHVAVFAPVAIHTALVFLALAFGLLAASPDVGLVRLTTSHDVAGVLIRRLLPAVIVLPVLVGWIRLAGQRAGYYGTEFGLALYAMSNIVVLTAVVYWTAVQIQRSDLGRRIASASLHESESRYRLLLEGVPQLVWTCLPDGHCDYLSPQWVKYTGMPEAEQLGYAWTAVVHPDDRAPLMERWEAAVRSGHPFHVEFRIRGADGAYRWFMTRAVLYGDEGGRKWFGTCTDIDDEKAGEAALVELNATLEARVIDRTASLAANEALIRQFVKYSPAAIAMFDNQLRYLQMSDRWLIDYHLTGRDITGLSHYEVFPDVPDNWKAIHQRVLAGAVESCDEDAFHRDDGTTEWLQWECRPWYEAPARIGGIIMFTQVITERKLIEQQVKASLREKEVLLKEIHHRVKNNLQIVSTLLDLQSDHTDDPRALEMFRESRGRVRSMALIHERLYRAHDVARVDFAEYVRQLADDLYRAYKASDDEVTLAVDVDIPPLSIDIAIPCGLLLNELMSNCFKHAFKATGRGAILVGLHREPDGTNVMIVSDTGPGLPAGTDFRNTASFGMQLVNTLTEQLNGQISLVSGPGSTFTVRFPTPQGQADAALAQ